MNKGFTVLELLVTIAIIGTLSTYILSSVSESRKKADYTRVYIEARELLTGLNEYMVTFGDYPILRGCMEASNMTHSGYRNLTGETEYYYPLITDVLPSGECLSTGATSSEPTSSHVLKTLKDEGLLNINLKVPLGVSVFYGLMTQSLFTSSIFYCGEDRITLNKPGIFITVPLADAKYLPATAKKRRVENINTGTIIVVPNSYCLYID